jgi:hypothetical protein
MTDKSYVTMEQHICPICGINHDTGALLLHRRLRKTFDRSTLTGFSLCQECESRSAEYLALVVIEPTRCNPPHKPDTVYRTGEYLHLRRAVAAQLFNIETGAFPFIYIDPECADRLKQMIQESLQ